jgi:hypothetical protein
MGLAGSRWDSAVPVTRQRAAEGSPTKVLWGRDCGLSLPVLNRLMCWVFCFSVVVERQSYFSEIRVVCPLRETFLIGVNNLSGRRTGQTSEETGQQGRLFYKGLRPWLELVCGYSWGQ